MQASNAGKQAEWTTKMPQKENEDLSFYETQAENVFWLYPGSPAV